MIHLLLQLAAVLGVTYLCGMLSRRLAQPFVVGEIAGGLLLGPLVFGQAAPRLQAALFSAGSLQSLELLSRIGLVLFLFLIGVELDLTAIRRSSRTVAAVTAGSMLLPFALGLAVAPLLWRRFAAGGGFLSFALFVAVAMSLTALPVLASLLRDRAANGRPVQADSAAVSLLSASVNDVLGWCVLAAVLTFLHRAGGWTGIAGRGIWLGLLIATIVLAVRPLLRWLFRAAPTTVACAASVLLAMLCASLTDRLGLHLFFGAFLTGMCLPRNQMHLLRSMQRWLAPVVRCTLPVFFALTGLRMQPGLFHVTGFFYLLLIVAVAVFGKVAGAAGMARWSGMGWHPSAQVGVLLNTRGLVELIVLNVGYQEGVLRADLFTLFVLMALVTTAMTAPLLDALMRVSNPALRST